jgi:hypothetical protein
MSVDPDPALIDETRRRGDDVAETPQLARREDSRVHRPGRFSVASTRRELG